MWTDALRFSINIAVCYLIAYGIAQPLTNWIVPLLGWPILVRWQGELSLLAGNGLHLDEERLKELVGHTPVQVLAGALLGILIGALVA